jgi:SAM-dependent methyltransferase
MPGLARLDVIDQDVKMSDHSTPAIGDDSVQSRVIEEFGEQWTRYTDNEGYYGSPELLRDLLAPLVDPAELAGRVIADVGSGTGRIINMLATAQPAKLIAIEPSAAMQALRKNTAHLSIPIEYLPVAGDAWVHPGLDYVTSIGVLHHIPDPGPTVRNMHANLKPGGKAIVWLYGREGNEMYLRLVGPIRKVTPRLPHAALAAIVWLLYVPLCLYVLLCRVLPLPMRAYMRNHIGRLDGKARRLTIYDQLNPTWAKYYRREEAESLLRDAGFRDVASHHRHGYSWTVVGTK